MWDLLQRGSILSQSEFPDQATVSMRWVSCVSLLSIMNMLVLSVTVLLCSHQVHRSGQFRELIDRLCNLCW